MITLVGPKQIAGTLEATNPPTPPAVAERPPGDPARLRISR
jgi:hypothetical protein